MPCRIATSTQHVSRSEWNPLMNMLCTSRDEVLYPMDGSSRTNVARCTSANMAPPTNCTGTVHRQLSPRMGNRDPSQNTSGVSAAQIHASRPADQNAGFHEIFCEYARERSVWL